MAAAVDTRMAATSLASDCHSSIEFFLAVDGLKKSDLFSNSDPFCVVLLDGLEIGRTEVVIDQQSCSFSKQFHVDYYFEAVQTITILVYDEDKRHSTNLSDHDFQGGTQFDLSELMCSHGTSLSKPLGRGTSSKKTTQFKLQGSSNTGSVTISGEERASCHDYVTFQLKGAKLPNKDGWGILNKSDPFYSIFRSREDGSWVQVFKSTVVMDNLNPTWPPVKLSVQSLCNGDYDRALRIEVWDWDKNGAHDSMGSTETTLRSVIEKQPMPVQERTKKPGVMKPAGQLHVLSASVSKEYTFLDYIQSGWELNMVVAIDFTGSNGNPSTPGTLHYLDPTGHAQNQYEATLTGLSSVLEQYDTDQLLPAYGFGARGGADRRVSHCFPLNGNPQNPYVQGVDGVMNAYHSALGQWGLSGPTNFAPSLSAAMNMASRHQSEESNTYTIMLIITDGLITDMQATINALVSASVLPISVLIVGVGDADFSGMEALDGDDQGLVNDRGQHAARDVVQFVKFSDWARAPPGRFAKEALEELPTQMMAYFKARQIKPTVVPKGPVMSQAASMASRPDPEQAHLAEAGRRMLQGI